MTEKTSFADRLRPAPVDGGFCMDNHWVWCGSVIRDDHGHYHMFASSWEKNLAFSPHWLTNSQVVRAQADRPEGPYEFQEVILPPRGENFWDGKMTHNPSIHRSGDTYLLYYTGTTYDGQTPTAQAPLVSGDAGNMKNLDPRVVQAHANQRIGLATAPSPFGPWTRYDRPVLEPRPDHWDALITTNPAPCVLEDGRVLLIYKSVAQRGDLMRFGAAMADHFQGTYRRLQDGPILDFGATGDHVEDPCVWRQDGRFQMIMKDMHGGIGGEKRGGVRAGSEDGIHWQIADPAKAYSRTVTWDNGQTTTQNFLERPQLLIQDGQPTHFFAATAVGSDQIGQVTRTWNMVIPLA